MNSIFVRLHILHATFLSLSAEVQM